MLNHNNNTESFCAENPDSEILIDDVGLQAGNLIKKILNSDSNNLKDIKDLCERTIKISPEILFAQNGDGKTVLAALLEKNYFDIFIELLETSNDGIKKAKWLQEYQAHIMGLMLMENLKYPSLLITSHFKNYPQYINLQDQDGNTFLHCAINNGKSSVILTLINFENIKNLKNNKGETPAFLLYNHQFLGKNGKATTTFLIELLEKARNHRAYQENQQLSISLLTEIKNNNANNVENLLLQGAGSELTLSIQSKMEEQRHVEIYRLLFYFFPKINTNIHEDTIFHHAIKNNNVNFIEAALSTKKNVKYFNIIKNHENSSNETPLDIALKSKNFAIIKVLIDYADDSTHDILKKYIAYHYKIEIGTNELHLILHFAISIDDILLAAFIINNKKELLFEEDKYSYKARDIPSTEAIKKLVAAKENELITGILSNDANHKFEFFNLMKKMGKTRNNPIQIHNLKHLTATNKLQNEDIKSYIKKSYSVEIDTQETHVLMQAAIFLEDFALVNILYDRDNGIINQKDKHGKTSWDLAVLIKNKNILGTFKITQIVINPSSREDNLNIINEENNERTPLLSHKENVSNEINFEFKEYLKLITPRKPNVINLDSSINGEQSINNILIPDVQDPNNDEENLNLEIAIIQAQQANDREQRQQQLRQRRHACLEMLGQLAMCLGISIGGPAFIYWTFWSRSDETITFLLNIDGSNNNDSFCPGQSGHIESAFTDDDEFECLTLNNQTIGECPSVLCNNDELEVSLRNDQLTKFTLFNADNATQGYIQATLERGFLGGFSINLGTLHSETAPGYTFNVVVNEGNTLDFSVAPAASRSPSPRPPNPSSSSSPKPLAAKEICFTYTDTATAEGYFQFSSNYLTNAYCEPGCGENDILKNGGTLCATLVNNTSQISIWGNSLGNSATAYEGSLGAQAVYGNLTWTIISINGNNNNYSANFTGQAPKQALVVSYNVPGSLTPSPFPSPLASPPPSGSLSSPLASPPPSASASTPPSEQKTCFQYKDNTTPDGSLQITSNYITDGSCNPSCNADDVIPNGQTLCVSLLPGDASQVSIWANSLGDSYTDYEGSLGAQVTWSDLTWQIISADGNNNYSAIFTGQSPNQVLQVSYQNPPSMFNVRGLETNPAATSSALFNYLQGVGALITAITAPLSHVAGLLPSGEEAVELVSDVTTETVRSATASIAAPVFTVSTTGVLLGAGASLFVIAGAIGAVYYASRPQTPSRDETPRGWFSSVRSFFGNNQVQEDPVARLEQGQ